MLMILSVGSDLPFRNQLASFADLFQRSAFLVFFLLVLVARRFWFLECVG
jgi:hypothetical protein